MSQCIVAVVCVLISQSPCDPIIVCRDPFPPAPLQIWFPPTPPADETEEFYDDLVLDMSYVTRSTMSTAVLTAIAPYR